MHAFVYVPECVRVCMHVYVCMYVHAFVSMYVRTYVRVYVCMYVTIYIHAYIEDIYSFAVNTINIEMKTSVLSRVRSTSEN